MRAVALVERAFRRVAGGPHAEFLKVRLSGRYKSGGGKEENGRDEKAQSRRRWRHPKRGLGSNADSDGMGRYTAEGEASDNQKAKGEPDS